MTSAHALALEASPLPQSLEQGSALKGVVGLRMWFLAPLIFLVGCIATLSVNRLALDARNVALRQTLTERAEHVAGGIGESIEIRRQAVMQSRDFWRANDRVSDETWQILTKGVSDINEELQSVMWIDAEYTIRRFAPAGERDLENTAVSANALPFLNRIPHESTAVVVSSIVKSGGEIRFWLVAPLHRKNGQFDGFMIFSYNADKLFEKIAAETDPRIGFDLSTEAGQIYHRYTIKNEAAKALAVTLPVPFSNGLLTLRAFAAVDLFPDQTTLANTFLLGGFALTILISLMVLQMISLARARVEVHGTRAEAIAAEHRYRSLITNCGLGWVVLDDDLRVIEANEPYAEMTGHRAPAEIVGRRLSEWVVETQHGIIERARAGGPLGSFVTRQSRTDYRWLDGTIRNVQVDLTTREGRKGKEIVALCRDITNRIKINEELELRDRAMEASSAGIQITAVSGTTGRLVYCNRAFEDMTGYARADIIGRDPNMVGENIENADELRRILNAFNEGKSTTARLITKRKNGERFARQVTMTPVIGEGGMATHLISISTDVTDAERQAEHLRLRERAIEASQNGIMIIDARQTNLPIIFCNPAFEKITGYAPADVMGRNSRFLEGEDSSQPELDVIRRALIEKTSASVVLRNYRKDGMLFWNEFHIDPVVDEAGALTHYICVINNATSRKETEAQLLQAQKMDAIGQLTGGVAHDFNNLLTVVIGNAKLVQKNLGADERQQRRLSLVVRAAERGAELTQRLLAFSRKQTLRTEILDVNTMVQDMQQLVQRTIGENIVTKLGLSDAGCSVRVDRSQLENALLNLAINARDAMPGGGRLVVSTRHMELSAPVAGKMNVRPGRYVELAVSDTGVGMTKEIRDRAFEPFFTTKDVGKGTGLGLSMVFGFVKQSDGHVSIYSEVGLGTTVKLYLPSMNEAQKEPEAASGTPDESSVPGNFRVLVVEDDENVRATTTAILENAGFEVKEASSAAAALIQLEADSNFDVVFSDVVMPGNINGIELFRLIRKRYPQIHVALTSGYSSEALKIDLDDANRPLLINKPYDPGQLAVVLARLGSGRGVKQL